MQRLADEVFSLMDATAVEVAIQAHSSGIYFTNGNIARYYVQNFFDNSIVVPLDHLGEFVDIPTLADSLASLKAKRY